MNQGGQVLARWQFWVTTVVALLVAATAAYTMVLTSRNRDAQNDFVGRGRFIQESIQLEGLYRETVKALADLSIRTQDKALSDLLTSQGITVTPPSPASSSSAPSPTTSAEPKKGAR